MTTRLNIVLSSLGLLSMPANAAYILSFDSSPQSWVGQGRSFDVTPESGYLFVMTGASSSFASIRVASLNSPFGPNWNPSSGEEYHYWTLDVAAPQGTLLTPGVYTGAARYPFQGATQPGLTFSGDHRGNNQNAGFFEIREIVRTPTGDIDRLAVDFTQYDETNERAWVVGQLRFNSALPIPEPSVGGIITMGMALLMQRRPNSSHRWRSYAA